jgi:ACS family tartrate transporter-like MFS transporter
MSTTMRPSTLEAATIRRVSWRLMPFLLLAYLICYIDRVNVGFAALQMNRAVGIDPKLYGLGAGIFFVGYFILEVPSNLALEHFGARTWIARIMITWGAVSAAFALIGGPVSFLVLRFLLGAAEAGFFPGVILYITYWYPRHYRAIIVGIFMVAGYRFYAVSRSQALSARRSRAASCIWMDCWGSAGGSGSSCWRPPPPYCWGLPPLSG